VTQTLRHTAFTATDNDGLGPGRIRFSKYAQLNGPVSGKLLTWWVGRLTGSWCRFEIFELASLIKELDNFIGHSESAAVPVGPLPGFQVRPVRERTSQEFRQAPIGKLASHRRKP